MAPKTTGREGEMRNGENDFKFWPHPAGSMWAKSHSTFRLHGASYPPWIVRRVVRNNGIIFVWPSPERLLYDRLVATAKVL